MLCNYCIISDRVVKGYVVLSRRTFAKITSSIIGTFHYMVPERRTCRFPMKLFIERRNETEIL